MARRPVSLDPNDFQDEKSWMENFTAARRKLEAAVLEKRKAMDELESRHRDALVQVESELAEVKRIGQEELFRWAPVRAGEVADVPVQRAAYSDRMAALMAKLAFLAYVRFEQADMREVLQRAVVEGGMKLCATYAIDDTEAFLVEASDFCAIVFRGTTSKADGRTNLTLRAESVAVPDHPKQVRVHAGFYKAFEKVDKAIRHDLETRFLDKPIYLAGHSLGGALALVASAAYGASEVLGPRLAAVYTFGAPRVGGADFDEIVKAPHYRVVSGIDVVPFLPPTAFFGYRHTGAVKYLRGRRGAPVRGTPPGIAVIVPLLSILLWPFTGSALGLKDHKIGSYVAKLDLIARNRGRWR